MVKKCSTCRLDLEQNKFTKDKSKKDGLKINCIECCKTYYNNYLNNNRETERKRSSRYNKEKRKINKEAIKLYKQNYFQKTRRKLKSKDRNIDKKIKIVLTIKEN